MQNLEEIELNPPSYASPNFRFLSISETKTSSITGCREELRCYYADRPALGKHFGVINLFVPVKDIISNIRKFEDHLKIKGSDRAVIKKIKWINDNRDAPLNSYYFKLGWWGNSCIRFDVLTALIKSKDFNFETLSDSVYFNQVNSKRVLECFLSGNVNKSKDFLFSGIQTLGDDSVERIQKVLVKE